MNGIQGHEGDVGDKKLELRTLGLTQRRSHVGGWGSRGTDGARSTNARFHSRIQARGKTNPNFFVLFSALISAAIPLRSRPQPGLQSGSRDLSAEALAKEEAPAEQARFPPPFQSLACTIL